MGHKSPPDAPGTTYVHISPVHACVAQTQRCAEHIEASSSDPQRLIDAIRCGHLAVMAALTEALSGSAGVGAYSDKLARDHLDFLQGLRPDFPGEFTLPFSALFARAQEPDRTEYGAIEFAAGEKRAAAEIDRYRMLIDHPKPALYAIDLTSLFGTLRPVPSIIEKCVKSARHRYMDGPDVRVQQALERMKIALVRAESR